MTAHNAAYVVSRAAIGKSKEVKDKPKGGELPKMEGKAKTPKAPGAEIKTKSGGEVTTKDKKGVTSGTK